MSHLQRALRGSHEIRSSLCLGPGYPTIRDVLTGSVYLWHLRYNVTDLNPSEPATVAWVRKQLQIPGKRWASRA